MMLSTATIITPSEIKDTIINASHIIITVINKFNNDVFFFFSSNVDDLSLIDNSSSTALLDNGFTQYTFFTGWAGQICVGLNFNPNDSKIKDNYTDLSDINVNYVNGFSVSIICSFKNTPISGCNIDLFKQPNISCINQVEGPVCLNPAQGLANGPALLFFAACKGAAYTYPNDNNVNISNFKSTLISCCIGMLCAAPLWQLKQ